MNRKHDGFTLLELIAVIAILGIIAALAVPKLIGYKRLAEERVCDTNRKTVEKMYKAFLLEKDIDYESAFDQFLKDNFKVVCPSGGVISYKDEKVNCSVHEDESQGEQVPWL